MKENKVMNLRVQGRETWKGFDNGKKTWGDYILILKIKYPRHYILHLNSYQILNTILKQYLYPSNRQYPNF